MLKILVVEDDFLTSHLLTTVLTQQGYSVSTAHNGIAALERIKVDCPNVVVSDLVMPAMDGETLLEEVRALEPTCKIFFILITGHPTVPRVVSAVTRGADEVLLKPLDIDKLLLTLSRAKGLIDG